MLTRWVRIPSERRFASARGHGSHIRNLSRLVNGSQEAVKLCSYAGR